MSERCPGCYEDPSHGHMFDCPTRIRDLEAEVERLRYALAEVKRLADSRIAGDRTQWSPLVVARVTRRALNHETNALKGGTDA